MNWWSRFLYGFVISLIALGYWFMALRIMGAFWSN